MSPLLGALVFLAAGLPGWTIAAMNERHLLVTIRRKGMAEVERLRSLSRAFPSFRLHDPWLRVERLNS
jgi:hypothetical protein